MTETEATEAILEQWENGWELLHPSDPSDPDHVPVAYDNEAATGVQAWARLTIGFTTRNQVTLGPRGTRRVLMTGNVAVQLFGDADRGALFLARLADDVRTVLELQEIAVGANAIYVYAGASQPPTTDARWFMKLVILPFKIYSQV